MNRERNLIGSNGYSKEIGFNPVEFLRERVPQVGKAAWLDLCCGAGNGLIEAAHVIEDDGLAEKIAIVGVDLVGMFHPPNRDQSRLRLVAASLSYWSPTDSFDLITCVHGLHYIGDKLGLVSRAISWLTDMGLFVANLDISNLKFVDSSAKARRVSTELRRVGLEYDRRRRRVICRGKRTITLPYRYLGADDQAGPNYTGQPAVDSYYICVAATGR
jgi:trans-aconitate methyltransferase